MQYCELCTKPNPNPKNRFCSARCRNINNSGQKPKGKFSKKTCPICGHIAYRINVYCVKHGGKTGGKGKPQIWNDQRDDYLRLYYPHKGATQVAQEIGLTPMQVRNRANMLKVTLTKEASRKIVHSKAKEYMTNNNPMKSQEVVDKIREHYRQHPDKRKRTMAKLFEGHAKLQKSNPTKLEIKLFDTLRELGVAFEPHFLIKPKFIVDAKIGNLIIQADGDYWHGHPRFEPLTDRQQKQRQRDKAQDKYLSKCGYAVARIWECELAKEMVIAILKKHDILR